MRLLLAALPWPRRYGWRVEAWWQLEQACNRYYTARMLREEAAGRDPDENLPALYEWIAALAYRRRKAAERRRTAREESRARA